MGVGAGCWDPPFPLWASASSSVTRTESEGCQRLWLTPSKGASLPALLAPPSLPPPHPMISTGNWAPGKPAASPLPLPSFLLLQVRPAPQGWGRDSEWRLLSGQPLETPLETPSRNETPQSCSAAVLRCPPHPHPRLDGSSETIPGPSGLLGRLGPRDGPGKPEVTWAKQRQS